MSLLSDLAEIATIATAIIALVAVKVANDQINSSNNSAKEANKTAKEATATDLYNSCLTMALQYPKFANPRHESFSESEMRSYKWFLASLLLSSEQILEVTDGDDSWRNSVKATLRRHAQALAERQANQKTNLDKFYHPRLVEVVLEVISERDQEFGSYR